MILFLAGGIGGSGINVSHELFHKIETNEYIDFIIGNLNLSKSLYIHFVNIIDFIINIFLYSNYIVFN